MSRAHSPIFPSPDLRHNSFSNTFVALHTSAHSLTLPSLHLRHSSFSNPSFASPTSQALHLIHQRSFSNLSVTSPTSQIILQPFRRFTYVAAHSPTLPLLHLLNSSFSNPSIASPRRQLILQPLFCFSYIISSSLNSPGEPTMEIWIVRNKNEDKISGHSSVEQATTVSFSEMPSTS